MKKIFYGLFIALLVLCGALSYYTTAQNATYSEIYGHGDVWIYENEVTGKQYLVYKNAQGGTNTIMIDSLKGYDFVSR